MSKESKLRKRTVPLEPPPRPSRIRREPPPPDKGVASLANKVDWGSREWEIRFAIAGIIFFAVAISAVVIDLGHLLSQ
ncbi:MAG TPA: hypothetical protein VJM15_07940 [Sphingomicrobium sp.]|nr:hypothetical protein [Sphingomicrobium sp.]